MGAVQVGMLRALIEAGIVPEMLVGTSVGAVNSVWLGRDPSIKGIESLEGLWHRMKREDLFPGGRLSTAWNALRKGSFVYSNSGMRHVVEAEGFTTFEDLAVPVHVNATNLDTGEEIWFDKGPLMDPLLASCAMPGIFPPVVIDGALCIDGGVANNIPVSRAVEMGARVVYVLNVNAAAQRRELSRPHDYVMHGLVLARVQRYRRELERYGKRARIIEMPTCDVGYIPFTNMSQTERLMKTGEEVARTFLAEQGAGDRRRTG